MVRVVDPRDSTVWAVKSSRKLTRLIWWSHSQRSKCHGAKIWRVERARSMTSKMSINHRCQFPGMKLRLRVEWFEWTITVTVFIFERICFRSDHTLYAIDHCPFLFFDIVQGLHPSQNFCIHATCSVSTRVFGEQWIIDKDLTQQARYHRKNNFAFCNTPETYYKERLSINSTV